MSKKDISLQDLLSLADEPESKSEEKRTISASSTSKSKGGFWSGLFGSKGSKSESEVNTKVVSTDEHQLLSAEKALDEQVSSSNAQEQVPSSDADLETANSTISSEVNDVIESAAKVQASGELFTEVNSVSPKAEEVLADTKAVNAKSTNSKVETTNLEADLDQLLVSNKKTASNTSEVTLSDTSADNEDLFAALDTTAASLAASKSKKAKKSAKDFSLNALDLEQALAATDSQGADKEKVESNAAESVDLSANKNTDRSAYSNADKSADGSFDELATGTANLDSVATLDNVDEASEDLFTSSKSGKGVAGAKEDSNKKDTAATSSKSTKSAKRTKALDSFFAELDLNSYAEQEQVSNKSVIDEELIVSSDVVKSLELNKADKVTSAKAKNSEDDLFAGLSTGKATSSSAKSKSSTTSKLASKNIVHDLEGLFSDPSGLDEQAQTLFTEKTKTSATKSSNVKSSSSKSSNANLSSSSNASNSFATLDDLEATPTIGFQDLHASSLESLFTPGLFSVESSNSTNATDAKTHSKTSAAKAQTNSTAAAQVSSEASANNDLLGDIVDDLKSGELTSEKAQAELAALQAQGKAEKTKASVTPSDDLFASLNLANVEEEEEESEKTGVLIAAPRIDNSFFTAASPTKATSSLEEQETTEAKLSASVEQRNASVVEQVNTSDKEQVNVSAKDQEVDSFDTIPRRVKFSPVEGSLIPAPTLNWSLNDLEQDIAKNNTNNPTSTDSKTSTNGSLLVNTPANAQASSNNKIPTSEISLPPISPVKLKISASLGFNADPDQDPAFTAKTGRRRLVDGQPHFADNSEQTFTTSVYTGDKGMFFVKIPTKTFDGHSSDALSIGQGIDLALNDELNGKLAFNVPEASIASLQAELDNTQHDIISKPIVSADDSLVNSSLRMVQHAQSAATKAKKLAEVSYLGYRQELLRQRLAGVKIELAAPIDEQANAQVPVWYDGFPIFAKDLDERNHDEKVTQMRIRHQYDGEFFHLISPRIVTAPVLSKGELLKTFYESEMIDLPGGVTFKQFLKQQKVNFADHLTINGLGRATELALIAGQEIVTFVLASNQPYLLIDKFVSPRTKLLILDAKLRAVKTAVQLGQLTPAQAQMLAADLPAKIAEQELGNIVTPPTVDMVGNNVFVEDDLAAFNEKYKDLKAELAAKKASFAMAAGSKTIAVPNLSLLEGQTVGALAENEKELASSKEGAKSHASSTTNTTDPFTAPQKVMVPLPKKIDFAGKKIKVLGEDAPEVSTSAKAEQSVAANTEQSTSTITEPFTTEKNEQSTSEVVQLTSAVEQSTPVDEKSTPVAEKSTPAKVEQTAIAGASNESQVNEVTGIPEMPSLFVDFTTEVPTVQQEASSNAVETKKELEQAVVTYTPIAETQEFISPFIMPSFNLNDNSEQTTQNNAKAQDKVEVEETSTNESDDFAYPQLPASVPFNVKNQD
ncbi:hypothetical protein [Psittacicella hinzii]|uniref:Uncharacterized protein n=1 Tax=Psittacicella hinzii TaxID=2028575 RepID=A0A3A1YMB3_9GAMM|nr:hypothetical protein [Psittacicella hinzii]RIY38606.1 hypothetical protein CKF58_03835 [Psittacicella hinzii]